jgi:hypothetical protein
MLTTNKYDIYPFGPLLVSFELPEDLTDWLLGEANKVRGNKELSANKDLAGQLKEQYYFTDEIKEEFFKKVNPVFSQYRNIHCDFHKLPQKKLEWSARVLWVNFMKQHEANPVHNHGDDYSFVYFLNDVDLSEEHKNHVARSNLPGNVGFSFGEPQPVDRKWATQQRWFEPRKNLMIMFPALLQHYVMPYHTDVERISVSGNIKILNKEKLQPKQGDAQDRRHEFYF